MYFKIGLILVFWLVMMDLSYGCFPKSDQIIPPPMQKNFVLSETESGLNQFEFVDVTQRFLSFWKSKIDKKYAKQLIVNGIWEDNTVDAYATRDDNNNPMIVIHGGLARHKDMTKNGMLLILCHELGHHYGGAPKAFRGRSKKRSWSSAEGQADYYASSKCFNKMVEEGMTYTEEPPFAVELPENCNDSLCIQLGPAAMSLGRVFASLKLDWRNPNPKGKSHIIVDQTRYSHPDPQCRFDTYMAGAECAYNNEADFDNSDHKIGACHGGFLPKASRPKCWFAPARY